MTATLNDPRHRVSMAASNGRLRTRLAGVPANRAYRDAGGPATQLWELPDTGHTGGLRTHPAASEQRTTRFLDQALGLKETS